MLGVAGKNDSDTQIMCETDVTWASSYADSANLFLARVFLGRLITRLSLEKEAYREIAEGKW